MLLGRHRGTDEDRVHVGQRDPAVGDRVGGALRAIDLARRELLVADGDERAGRDHDRDDGADREVAQLADDGMTHFALAPST